MFGFMQTPQCWYNIVQSWRNISLDCANTCLLKKSYYFFVSFIQFTDVAFQHNIILALHFFSTAANLGLYDRN